MPRSVVGGQSKLSARLHKEHARGETPIPDDLEDLEETLEGDVEEKLIDLASLSYRELQTLAKNHGIVASGMRSDIEKELQDLFGGE